MIQAITEYYRSQNANIHRGVHSWSIKATELYEQTRESVSKFIGAKHTSEIIFTSGTTDSINLLADGLFNSYLQQDDEIILSVLEHHSNILPWQTRANKFGVKLKYAQLDKNLSIDVMHLQSLITDKTKLIAIAHVSNTLGVINPIQDIIQIAKKNNIPIFIDAAQSVPHITVNAEELNIDFLAFSAHKMYAPTGVGVLYLNKKWHDKFFPLKSGGGAIKDVDFYSTEFADMPQRLEAGTPNIEGIIGFNAALNYIQKNGGIEYFQTEEAEIYLYLLNKLTELSDDLDIYALHNPHKLSAISFNVKNIHPFDTGTLLNQYGVAVRTGHHCTQLLMKHLNIQGTVRASLAIYNTESEIDSFIIALKKTIKMLQ